MTNQALPKMRGVPLCLLLLLACTPSFARPPRSTEQRGIIATIDHSAHTLRLRRGGDTPLLMLLWTDRTRFIKHDRFVSSTAFKEGVPVTVWYRSPLFGPRWAAKIRTEDGAEVTARNKGYFSRHAKP